MTAEDILAEDVVIDIIPKLFCVLAYSFRTAETDPFIRPGSPHDLVEMVFDCCEKSKILHPGIHGNKLTDLPAEAGGGLLIAAAEKHLLVFTDSIKLDCLRILRNKFLTVVVLQKTFFPKPLAGNQQRIAGKHGRGLVGAFAVAGRTDGQNLPDGHAGGLKEVRKFICFLSHRADSAGRGERRDVHQNTAGAHRIPSFQENSLRVLALGQGFT